jgi:hypothetical protein
MEIKQRKNLQAKEYEYLWLNIFVRLVKTCDDFSLIKDFKNKILMTNFHSVKAFNYFCKSFRKHGLMSSE